MCLFLFITENVISLEFGSDLEPCAKERLLDEFKASHATANEPRAVVENEVQSYINHVPTDKEEQIALSFWKMYSDQYPNLAAVASEHFSIPATSVPVEAMFSTTRFILNLK